MEKNERLCGLHAVQFICERKGTEPAVSPGRPSQRCTDRRNQKADGKRLQSQKGSQARAGQAVDSVALDEDPTQVLKPAVNPIYVFRIGASHGVRFSGGADSHFNFVMFFGPSWEYLSIGAF